MQYTCAAQIVVCIVRIPTVLCYAVTLSLGHSQSEGARMAGTGPAIHGAHAHLPLLRRFSVVYVVITLRKVQLARFINHGHRDVIHNVTSKNDYGHISHIKIFKYADIFTNIKTANEHQI